MHATTSLADQIAMATGRRKTELIRLLRRLPGGALPRSFDELIDAMVEGIDHDLTTQLDTILAHPDFVRVEATWLGLRLLVWRLPQDRALKVELVHCSLDDLAADFHRARDVKRSGLYALVEAGGRRGFGGRPYAAVFCHHAFEAADLPVLERCAAVGEAAGLPFVGSAGEQLLARASRAWEAFRAKASARFVALVAGRWLARPPHRGEPDTECTWLFHESDRALRFASATFLLAQRFATSFVAFRTPIHAFGPNMGRVEALPRHRGRSTQGAVPLGEAEVYGARGVIPLVEVGPGLVEFAGSATCLGIRAVAQEGELNVDLAQHARLQSVLEAARAAGEAARAAGEPVAEAARAEGERPAEAARATGKPTALPRKPIRSTRGAKPPSEQVPLLAPRASRETSLSRR